MLKRQAYRADRDLERVADLLSRSWTPTGPFTTWHIGNLCWWERRDWSRENWLWEDEAGSLIGFEDSDPHGCFQLLIDPKTVGTDAHREMLTQIEARPRLAVPEEQGEDGFRTFVAEDSAALQAFWEENDYARTGYHAVQMLCSLAQPVEPPCLPTGYHIRSLSGAQDIPGRLAIQEAVFHSVTEARYRRIMHLSLYRQDLDLVAVAPDGTFAGSCLLWLDRRNRLGQIGPVGTHPDYRREGLASALIGEGLRRLQSLGAATAHVIPDGAGEDLIQFYQKCGFHVARRDYLYFKRARL